ncbi:NADP-dependent phosphogluconate dehydrogenase [Erysipelotrichaceae bacterium OH741_COT-311]|nr:NADP-dependent phosphogluconate dehydrogenase [Erysipelotrichaceae bacterium OH741_COT-311]
MNDIGVIGLGVMGKSIAINMANHGFSVSGFNRTYAKTQELVNTNIKNIYGYEHLEDFVASLSVPRRILLMVPAGKSVDGVLEELLKYLSEGDIIMDGGNSFFEDTNTRYTWLKEKGIIYFGVGISGGEQGALYGPSIMPSGDQQHYPLISNILESIAAEKGQEACCRYIGPMGSGHYVKMVHNGIEYADMQLLAEVYLILKHHLGLTNKEIAHILNQWNQREVASYLVKITAEVLLAKDDLGSNDLIDVILDVAGNKGTGRWTSIEALRQEFNASLLTAAYQARIMSNQHTLREAFVKKPSKEVTTSLEIETIYQAYALAKSLAFAQGFQLYQDASDRYGWNLNLKEIASIFRAGCIIQAELLQTIMHAYQDGVSQLLLHPTFYKQVKEHSPDLAKVTATSLAGGLPLPLFASALVYVNQLQSEWLGANLIQGQRDYFGAHTYKRVDRDGDYHYPWSQDHE